MNFLIFFYCNQKGVYQTDLYRSQNFQTNKSHLRYKIIFLHILIVFRAYMRIFGQFCRFKEIFYQFFFR